MTTDDRPQKRSARRQPKPDDPILPIIYRVVPERLGTQCYQVICQIANPSPDGQIVSLPAWIPGSYKIRDYAKQIVEIAAESEGKTIPLTKLDKQTWKAGRCRGSLTIAYRVYARDKSVRGAWLSTDRGFINGVALFLQIHGQEATPVVLEIYRPTEECARYWTLATVLPRRGDLPDGMGRFEAPNYETLIDSPIAMGSFQTTSFDVYGTPHKIVVSGATGEVDMDRLAADCKALCETQMTFFGVPYPISSYLFLIQAGTGFGGLEHRSCSALQCGRENLPMAGRKPVGRYVALLRLISHEYFHLWHVKRIRPAELVDASLQTEAYTRQLWIFEGLTAYYENLLLLRAKLINETDFLLLTAQSLFELETTPGRKRQSVADSSFDAWIKLYHMAEISPHATVSYYLKGAIIGMLLDLTIRDKTDGDRSLDDVMRALWQQFGRPEIPLKEGEFEDLCEEVAGVRLKPALARWVASVDELPVEVLLKRMAIQLERRYRTLPDLGMRFVEKGGLLEIVSIVDEGPAQRAGLIVGDEIVAFDSVRMNSKQFDICLETMSEGHNVSIAYLRGDVLGKTTLTLGPPSLDCIVLKLLQSARHRRAVELRRRWFHPPIGRRNLSFL